jgi:hypothetical protein
VQPDGNVVTTGDAFSETTFGDVALVRYLNAASSEERDGREQLVALLITVKTGAVGPGSSLERKLTYAIREYDRGNAG